MPWPLTASANGGRAGLWKLIGRAIAIDRVDLMTQHCVIGFGRLRIRGGALVIGDFSSCCVGMAKVQAGTASIDFIARKA